MTIDHPIPFAALVTDLVELRADDKMLSPEQALVRLRGWNRIVLLHSAGGRPARFSLLGFDPVLSLDGCDEEASSPPRSFLELQALLANLQVTGQIPGPFHGGFLGAISYDFGAANLSLDLPREQQPEPFQQPSVVGGIYTDFLVWDHERATCHVVINRSRENFEERLERLSQSLRGDAGHQTFSVCAPFRRAIPPAQHQARIEKIREAIQRGDLYQANLAHRIYGQVRGDAVDVYCALVVQPRTVYGVRLVAQRRATLGLARVAIGARSQWCW